MILKIKSGSLSGRLLRSVLENFVIKDVEKNGMCKGKIVLADSIGEKGHFTIRWLYTDEMEGQLLEALASVFEYNKVQRYVMAFAGSIGEPPEGEVDTLLVECVRGATSLVIRQFRTLYDNKNISGFEEVLVDELNYDSELNLLRMTNMPIQDARRFLEARKKEKEQLIILGPNFLADDEAEYIAEMNRLMKNKH